MHHVMILIKQTIVISLGLMIDGFRGFFTKRSLKKLKKSHLTENLHQRCA